ncbi:MAG TPA: VOC family protein [Acidimicrobiia bacterium]|nr:VOC family protein [Acidimicrobiia bacterium]
MSETQTITVQIVTDNARRLIAFVEDVFGGETTGIYEDGDHVIHSQVVVGNSNLFISDSSDEFGPFPAMLNVYVDDVDAVHAKALEKGATNLRHPEDQFYGERTGGVLDNHGNQWWIATRIEEVSEDEMRRRMTEIGG